MFLNIKKIQGQTLKQRRVGAGDGGVQTESTFLLNLISTYHTEAKKSLKKKP